MRVTELLKEMLSEESYNVWVNDADYHLTLHFFGQLEEKDAVINMMNRMSVPTISLTFSKVAGFGQSDGYRVLFLEPEVTEPLRAMYESIQEALASKGFQVSHRPFHPHVTLAKKCRVHWNKENMLSRINTTLMIKYLPFDTHPISLVLYKIEPDNVPKYTVVFEKKMS
jgi:2'-5' RNA ligase